MDPIAVNYSMYAHGSFSHNMGHLEMNSNRRDSSSPDKGPNWTTDWDNYDSYRCGTPDLDELKLAIEDAKERRLEEKEQRRKVQNIHLDGIGTLVCQMRDEGPREEMKPEEKKRIVISGTGQILGGMRTRPKSKAKSLAVLPELVKNVAGLVDVELPPGPPHPTDPDEIRRLVRGKMPRCKVCRNRFGERNLLERHLRDHHHVEYLEYIAQQEEEIQLQKEEEQELNRLEELQSGGFIPPENELASLDIEVNRIPLPGEDTNGIVPRFDRNGMLRQPKRPYRKKVSPQCNFCDKRFRNEVSLKKHLLKKHPESIEFAQCLDCFKCLPEKDDLGNHDCDLTFMCYECLPMRNLCNAQRLLLHRAKFHRGANSGFRCNECNLKFLTPRKLRKHKKMAHVFTKTYGCHFCDELFTSEVSVITHERMHTGIIKFECRICDYRCSRYLEMETHKREEHGYLCSICRQPFAEWSGIKDHTLKDHGGYLTSESNTGQFNLSYQVLNISSTFSSIEGAWLISVSVHCKYGKKIRIGK
ncbi:hypothetical protein PENTCL1PPCAC_6630 [Pristionchus entomophagus]|uniref:C2H2-type domain-containing protein n=1 Tax=Pristionchus entomophagus TaxID=358040 RepID=A0AAV5SN81_9BILA|nr:hypothetical protein PENTCL1PPCAC_6630 [Pristionchus entomophagus]